MSRQRRALPNMNVTPLVDVVLVLLIIFMVVIPAMNKDADLDLPAITQPDEDPKSKTDPFTLSIDKDGTLFFEEHALTPEDFRTTLARANREQPGRRLVLRADKSLSYAEVRRFFSLCQEIGFPGVSLRVNTKGKRG